MTVKNILRGVSVSGQGPAVILLHSSLSSSRQWLPLVKLLTATHTVINIDIIGYGLAPKVADAENYDLSVELERIFGVIGHLVGEQNFHVVGHSCGGAIALKLAVQAPKRLVSLSLFEPVAFHLLPLNSAERTTALGFASKVKNSDRYVATEVFTDFWNKPGFFNSLSAKMQALMVNDIAKVNLDFQGLMAENYGLHEVATIACPVLMMAGKHSPQLSRHLAQMIIEVLPKVHYQQVEDGHMAPITLSDTVQPAIAAFILQQQ